MPKICTRPPEENTSGSRYPKKRENGSGRVHSAFRSRGYLCLAPLQTASWGTRRRPSPPTLLSAVELSCVPVVSRAASSHTYLMLTCRRTSLDKTKLTSMLGRTTTFPKPQVRACADGEAMCGGPPSGEHVGASPVLRDFNGNGSFLCPPFWCWQLFYFLFNWGVFPVVWNRFALS